MDSGPHARESLHLIPTKLFPPKIHGHILHRPHLFPRLHHGNGLVLISAPAGYGKTTLLASWLRTSPHAVAWLSLDKADSELTTFLRYLAAALEPLAPATSLHLSNLSNALDALSIRYIAQLLVNDLMALEQTCVLVLDDYHHIALDSPIHQVLSTVLDYLPPNIYLVLASRADPPLPLSRLRANRQLYEVRAAQLLWSQDELEAYLAEEPTLTLSSELLASLYTRTDGWAAGIQLSLVALQQQSESAAFVEAFTTSKRLMLEYLTDEVFIHLPKATQQFLLQVSILDRCCPALCAAITETTEAECDQILRWLITHNLFTTLIDAQNNWCYFHALFSDFLRSRLQQQLADEEICTLHRRAITWLSQQGYLEEAVYHALLADEPERAVGLIEAHRHHLLNHERLLELRHLLHLLPTDLIHRHAGLLLSRLTISPHYLPEVGNLLAEVEGLLRQDTSKDTDVTHRILGAEWMVIASVYWHWQGNGKRSLELALQALEQLPALHQYYRGEAHYYVATSYQLLGQMEQAVQQLQLLLMDVQEEDAAVRSRLWLALVKVYMVSGEWYQLATVAQQMRREAEHSNQIVNLGWAHYALGHLYYEWNQLDRAAEHFSAVIALGPRLRIVTLMWGHFGQALVYQARQQSEQASACLHVLIDRLQGHNTALLEQVEAFQAYLALQQDELEPAMSWVRVGMNGVSQDYRRSMKEVPLICAQILFTWHTPSTLKLADELLSNALERVQNDHNHWRMLEIFTLQALIYEGQGQREAALTRLERAVALGKRGGFIRTFVDMGPRLATLLAQLAARGVEVAYINRVLTAFPQSQHIAASPLSPVRLQLPEALTPREEEILGLLARRLSNQEIAQALTISLSTVKTHTTNLYQKLGVTKRRQAVAKAQSLGLLPATFLTHPHDLGTMSP